MKIKIYVTKPIRREIDILFVYWNNEPTGFAWPRHGEFSGDTKLRTSENLPVWNI